MIGYHSYFSFHLRIKLLLPCVIIFLLQVHGELHHSQFNKQSSADKLSKCLYNGQLLSPIDLMHGFWVLWVMLNFLYLGCKSRPIWICFNSIWCQQSKNMCSYWKSGMIFTEDVMLILSVFIRAYSLYRPPLSSTAGLHTH